MVRTKAGSVSTKAVGAKAPAKVAITTVLSGNTPKVRNHGNPYHPRETPGWQKPITFFMKQEAEGSRTDEENEKKPGGKKMKIVAGSSKNRSFEDVPEEEGGIPGISGEPSSSKVKQSNDNQIDEMDVDEEIQEPMKKSKGKGKGTAKGKAKGKSSDGNKSRIDDSDMEVEKEKGLIDEGESNDRSTEKVEDTKVIGKDTSEGKETDQGEGKEIDQSDDSVKVKEVQEAKNNEDTEDVREDKKIDSIDDKAVAKENNDKDSENNGDNESMNRIEHKVIVGENEGKDKSENRKKTESANSIKSKVVEEENKENDPKNDEIKLRE